MLYRKPDDTTLNDVLVEVLGDVGDTALKDRSASLSSSPKRATGPLTDTSLDQNIRDVGVVLGSVLTLRRTRPHANSKNVHLTRRWWEAKEAPSSLPLFPATIEAPHAT